MALGAGVYDDACTQARESTKARSVILMVVDGDKGSGFSAQSDDPMFQMQFPLILRRMADAIDEDLKKVHPIDKSVNSE